MNQTVQSIVTYPEQHAVWLEAMGVTRWQSKVELGTTQEASNPSNQTHTNQLLDSKATISKETILPESVLQARYWIIGEQALSAEEAYLLAGMMAAIKANTNEVIYSYIDSSKESASTQTQSSGLAVWPDLTVQIITGLNVAIPETLKVLLVGNHLELADFQYQGKVWQLPSLAHLIAEPLLKRDAWMTLKNMLAHENK